MKQKTRLILLLGFGTLIALIGFLAFSAFRRAERIYNDVSSIHDGYRRGITILNDIQNDILYSGILVRDYLLDRLPTSVSQHRNDLIELRSSLDKPLGELTVVVAHEDSDALQRLRKELDMYWDSLDPIFDWTPAHKAAFSLTFLRREVLPRRQALLSITKEIDDLNAASFRREQQKLAVSEGEFRSYLGRMFAVALTLALLVAGISFSRISRLEKRSEEERRRGEQAEHEMRRLSQKLVQAQEQERKSISRELHDEVGQMITALRMELTNLELLRLDPETGFSDHLSEAKDLAGKTLQSVRNLAMGLRPSMLDDLGLGPALHWQAREFSRRSGIPVTVQSDGDLENLPEDLRTCIYRVVQESFTNCARHAQAKEIHLTVRGVGGQVSMTIQDNGVGFNPGASRVQGLGLIGMEERVRELGGTISINSQPLKGTVIQIDVPLKREQPA